MKKRIFILIIIIFLVNVQNVNATPGALKKNSIISCNGVTYGQHMDGHWHVAVRTSKGGYNASGKEMYYYPCKSTSNQNTSQNIPSKNIVITKSADNSLLSIIVNNDKVEIKEELIYTTKQEKAVILATAGHSKATINYNKNVDLTIRENIVPIKVAAENGSVKEYKLVIVREKILSNNKNIVIKVDEKKLDFFEFENKEITIPFNQDNLNISYDLEDGNAKVIITGNENLTVGENEIIIKVIAENQEEQEYKIIVEKLEEEKEEIKDLSEIKRIIQYGIFFFKMFFNQ